MPALTRFAARSLLAIAFAGVTSVADGQQPRVTLSISHGSLPATPQQDWLLDPFSLFVAPGHPATATIVVSPTDPNFAPAPPFNGRLRLSATCCGSLVPPGVVNPGIDLRVNQSFPQAVGWPGATPAWLAARLAQAGPSISSSSALVDVPGVEKQATLNLTARPGASLGVWTLWVGAEAVRSGPPTRNPPNGQTPVASIGLTMTVLPAWPVAGPPPRCGGPTRVLDLSALRPYEAKDKKPSLTVYTIGARVPRAQVGLQFTIRKAAVNPPLKPNEAVVKVINRQGLAVGVRNANSNDCTAVNRTLLAEVGGPPATMGISSANTTTLVFSKSTCRASFIACWSWGLDDVVQLSEEAFWILFGGREVEIETVGDWGNELQWGDWVIGQVGP